MTGRWPLRSSLQLGAFPTATPCARLHAKQVLWEWGFHAIAETAELLVSELITNAVKAAQVSEDKPPVWLRLSAGRTRLLIEVWDGNTQPPQPRELQDGLPAFGDENGRGLYLVTMLSTRWSWYPTQRPAGKTVWCELDTDDPPDQERGDAAVQALLPRRTPRSRRARPVPAMDDPDTLRRVRDGLRRLA
jgi:anti-sigma regulatory factor (Ser/Thr protein kinase)